MTSRWGPRHGSRWSHSFTSVARRDRRYDSVRHSKNMYCVSGYGTQWVLDVWSVLGTRGARSSCIDVSRFSGRGSGRCRHRAARAAPGTDGNGMRSRSCQHALAMIATPFALYVYALQWSAYGDQGVPGPRPTGTNSPAGFGSLPANCGWRWDAVAPTTHMRFCHSAQLRVVFLYDNGGVHRVNMASPHCTVGVWGTHSVSGRRDGSWCLGYTKHNGATRRYITTVHRRPAKHPTR